MKYNLTFRFRIYSTDKQSQINNKIFGCTRFLYNRFLAQRKDSYELEKNP